MKYFFPLLIVLGSCLTAGAGSSSPRAIVEGPTTAIPGQFLLLSAKQSEGTPHLFKWTITPEIPGYKQLRILGDGSECEVATFPGVYVVTLAVANNEGIDSVRWQITIPGDARPCPTCPACPTCPSVPVPTPTPLPPGPVPTPTPTPTPVPVPGPDVDRLGIVDQVRREVAKIGDPAGSKAIAVRMRSLANLIREREVQRAKAVANGQTPPPAISFQDCINELASSIKLGKGKWETLLPVMVTICQALIRDGKVDIKDVNSILVLIDALVTAFETAAQ
jgi:hypothetical protein